MILGAIFACAAASLGCRDDGPPTAPPPVTHASDDDGAPPRDGDPPPATHRPDAEEDAEEARAQWSPAAIPEEVIGPRAAQAAVTRLADEGFSEALVDDDHGVYVAREGTEAAWLRGDPLNEATGDLRASLAGDELERRLTCLGSLCRLAPEGGEGPAWFLQTRTARGAGRHIAGAIEVGDTHMIPRYHAWLGAVSEPWASATGPLIGEALSAEEEAAFSDAHRLLTDAIELDPESPWPRFHRARIQTSAGAYREAYFDLRVVSTRNHPSAMSALVTATTDELLAPLRLHTAMDDLLAEARLAPPRDVATFVAYLRRVRASPPALRAVTVAEGGPSWEALGRALETYLFADPDVDEDALAVTFPDPSGDVVRLELTRDDAGALKVGALTHSAP